MQPYELVLMRRVVKRDPAIRSSYEEAALRLKAERVASPPGPGNLRKLKRQAEKDALAETYQSLSNDPAAARRYDATYARSKAITTRD